jgi:DNA (cytosine-5)-methyltransferase 1
LTVNKLRTGELFAGIGGIGLGLEMTGEFEVVWQVENDPYATKVLEKNWPKVKRHDDVSTFPPVEGDWDVDLITAGFPCTDLSIAGKQKGLEGDNSKLFYEIIRIARILRPRWLLLENVSALLIQGIGEVLGEMAAIPGNDNSPHFKRVEYHCLPASRLGAPHRRDRIFILAHTTKILSNSPLTGLEGFGRLEKASQIRTQKTLRVCSRETREDQWGTQCRLGVHPDGLSTGLDNNECGGWECGIDRLTINQVNRKDRLRCLGNAVVPQVAQFFGELILDKIRQQKEETAS